MPVRRVGFLKEMARQEKLVPHLNSWFLKSKEGLPEIRLPVSLFKEHDDAFHPSGDCVPCARTLYAARCGHALATETDSGREKTFANGHMWHALIYHVVVEGLGFSDWDHVEQEWRLQRISPDLDIQAAPFGPAQSGKDPIAEWWARGHIDMSQVKIPGHDEPFLVDVKTMNSRHFKLDTPPEPYWSKYKAQIAMYLDWADLDTAILLAVEMDSGYKFKEIEIGRNDDLVHSIYEKWDRVAEAQRAGSPPEHDCLDPANCDSKDIYVEDSPRRRSRRVANGLEPSRS
jgi:hypothetical protein